MNQISFVWAEDEAGWIGKNGQLPWHLPVDLKHFKLITMNHPVVMGANTFKSIGSPLPHRDNIVVSHHSINNDKIINVSSIDELLKYVNNQYQDEEICIIGGAGIFKQTQQYVNVLHRTVVQGNHQGDVKMIPIDYQKWQLTNKKEVPSTETSIPNCRFEDWTLNK